MIYELNHVGIMVRDIDATLDFYGALDARVVFSHSIPGRAELRYLQLAGSMLEFVAVADGPHRAADLVYGTDHLAFMTDDLDADYRRLLDSGCTVLGDGIHPTANGNGRLGKVYRPDGAKIELLQRDVDFRLPPEPGVVAAFEHYAYGADDLDEAFAFFTDVIGMAGVGPDGAPASDERRLLKLRRDALCLVPGSGGGGRLPYVRLRVDDLGTALATLAERGVSPVAPPLSESDAVLSALLEDPDGVRIQLGEPSRFGGKR